MTTLKQFMPVEKVRVIQGNAQTALPEGDYLGAINVPIEVSTNGVYTGLINIPPNHTSDPHHHSDQAVMLYVVSGDFNLIVEEGKEVYPLKTGDMAVVPSDTVHSEQNPSETEPCIFVAVLTDGEVPVLIDA